MKDSVRISCKRKITRFCVFLITILMTSTLACTVFAANTPVLKNVDIRLGDTIGLLFHTDIPYDSNIGTVKASVNNRDISQHVERYNNDNCYTFLVTGIYPHEISQKITLSLSGLNLQFQTSVKEELKKMINNSASEDEKLFASNLLQYGEATWQYREHVNGTNRPCDITTNVDGYAPSGGDITTSLINIGNSTSAVHISSIGIAYSDTNHYVIEVEVPQAMQAGAKIDIVFKRNDKVIKEESQTHEGGTQKYSFTSPALKAHKITTERIDVELKVNGTTVQTIERYGLNNFIAQLSEVGATSDQGTALQYAKALYYYGASAATVYNDKRVFAQYIDTSAMQNPRFIRDGNEVVFKCENAKMHVYYYDGTEADIADIAWEVENMPTVYKRDYDITVKGTARTNNEQEIKATTKPIRVINTATFKSTNPIFVTTHNNGALNLPAGKGEVIPAIGTPFQVEWSANTLSTTLEAANAKSTGMQKLALPHKFDCAGTEVEVDVPFVYCNTIKSIEIISTHKIKDAYPYGSPSVSVNANWQQLESGNVISLQPKSIRVFFDNGTQQDYSDIEAGWNVNAKTEDVKYASSISAESPYYNFSGGTKLPYDVFKTVYGPLVTDGIYPENFDDNNYSVSGKTQIMNRVTKIRIDDAKVQYLSSTSCHVNISLTLTLESGQTERLTVNEADDIYFGRRPRLDGDVIVADDSSDYIDWYIYTDNCTLIVEGGRGVSTSISNSYNITNIVDPITKIQLNETERHVFASNADDAKPLQITVEAMVTLTSGNTVPKTYSTDMENINDNTSSKSSKFAFVIDNGIGEEVVSSWITVTIWNPIIEFGEIDIDALDCSTNETLSLTGKTIGTTRLNGWKGNITLGECQVENYSGNSSYGYKETKYDEYSGACPLPTYEIPTITVLINNPVTSIEPKQNPTPISLNANQSSYNIPAKLVLKNGKDTPHTFYVTYSEIKSALQNTTHQNNKATYIYKAKYEQITKDIKLEVTIPITITPGNCVITLSQTSQTVNFPFTVTPTIGNSFSTSQEVTVPFIDSTAFSGTYNVTLKYDNISSVAEIKWNNPIVSVTAIKEAPKDITLQNGDPVTPTGGKITVKLSNGKSKDIVPASWSTVNYDGTELEVKQTVYPIYNGTTYTDKSASVTVYNPIKRLDAVKEYTLGAGQTHVTLDKTVNITLANGASSKVEATIRNASNQQKIPTATFLPTNGALQYRLDKEKAYRKLIYSYGAYDQEVDITVHNPVIEPEFILSAVNASKDMLYDEGDELIIQGTIIIKRNNGAEITVYNIAGQIAHVVNCQSSRDEDGIPNYTDNSEGEIGPYIINNMFSGKDKDGNTIYIPSISVKVANQVTSRAWEPVNIELSTPIYKTASDYKTEFDKFRVYLSLTNYYTNGEDSTSSISTPIGAGTTYSLCDNGWEPKLLNNALDRWFDNDAFLRPISFPPITCTDARWDNIKVFARNVGDNHNVPGSAHIDSVSDFVEFVYDFCDKVPEAEYFFFTAPDKPITLNNITYEMYPEGRTQYTGYWGGSSVRILTPLFQISQLFNANSGCVSPNSPAS